MFRTFQASFTAAAVVAVVFASVAVNSFAIFQAQSGPRSSADEASQSDLGTHQSQGAQFELAEELLTHWVDSQRRGNPSRSIEQLQQELGAAEGETEKEAIKKKIKDHLSAEYDEFLVKNQSELKRLEERVKKLRVDLDRRRIAKAQLLDLEVQRVLNEASGLGWPSTPANQGMASSVQAAVPRRVVIDTRNHSHSRHAQHHDHPSGVNHAPADALDIPEDPNIIELSLKYRQEDAAGLISHVSDALLEEAESSLRKELEQAEDKDSIEAIDAYTVARNIYSGIEQNPKLSQELIERTISLIDRAIEPDAHRPQMLDIKARLQHAVGDIEAAIETQTKAVSQPTAGLDEKEAFLIQLKAKKASSTP